MQKFYEIKKLVICSLFFTALIWCANSAKAQLAPGDLAVIGMNGGNDGGLNTGSPTGTFVRQFAIVAVADIDPDQDIFITDRGWVNSTATWAPIPNNNLEGTILWRPTSLITAGTIIIFKITAVNANTSVTPNVPKSVTVSATTGTNTVLSGVSISVGWENTGATSLPWASGAGDQLMIYKNVNNIPVFIYCFGNIRTTAKNNIDTTNPGWFLEVNPAPSNSTGYILPTSNATLFSALPTSVVGTKFYNGFFIDANTSSVTSPNVIYNPSGGATFSRSALLDELRLPAKWTVSSSANNFSDGFGAGNQKSFLVDDTRPTVVISSLAGASGTSTSTSPIPFTVTFSENVTGFVIGDLSIANGTPSGFSGSGTTYNFNVSPATPGTATTVNVPANVAQDAASNGNTAAMQFSITYQQILPVTLNNYTAKLEGKAVKLEWITTAEQRNSHFELWHAGDGKNFLLLDKVQGNGTTNQRHNYTFYDRKPQINANYYRLLQVDLDGKSRELGVKSVNFKLSENNGLSARPNPAKDKVIVDLSLGTTQVEIVDMTGKVCIAVNVNPTAISNEINIQALTAGTYFIRTRNPSGNSAIKLIKL